MARLSRLLRLSILLPVALVLFSGELAACQWIDEAAARAGARSTASLYWIATAVLAAAVLAIELYRRKWSPLVLATATLLVIFHPRWTLLDYYGPDCGFENVEGSRAVVIVAALLLAYEIARAVRHGVRPSPARRVGEEGPGTRPPGGP